MKNNEIESILKRIQPPTLENDKREAMKNRILTRIGSSKEVQIISSLRALKPVLAEKEKFGIWARISSRIDKTSMDFVSFIFPKKLIGGVMVMTLVLTLFNYVGIDNNVAVAEEFTVLKEFSGEVKVFRNGEVIRGKKDMKLFENDAVVTGKDGLASIVFFDDSVSRLSHDTSITLSHLSTNPDTESKVQLDLTDGLLWTRVLSLVEGDSTFSVRVDSVVAEADKKAAFNVEKDGDNSEIQVYNNSIQLKDLNNKKEEKLRSGQKAVVESKKIQYGTIAEDEKKVSWVKENLKVDNKYVAEIKQKTIEDKREKVEVAFKNASLLPSFDDVKNEKTKIGLLEKDLIEAELKIQGEDPSNENIEIFNTALAKFKSGVNNFYRIIDRVSEKDPKYAAELKVFIDGKLKSREKEFVLATPDSPIFEVKLAYNDLLLEGVKDPQQQVMIRYEQAQEELSEALEKFELGENAIAEVYLEKYQSGINKIWEIADLNELSNEKLILEMNEDMEIMKQLKVVSPVLSQTVLNVEKTRDDLSGTTVVVDNVLPVRESDPIKVELELNTGSAAPMPYGVRVEGEKPLPPL